MTDKTIRAVDLVYVARGMVCCGHPTGAEGRSFIVSEIVPGSHLDHCNYCDAVVPAPAAKGCPGRMGIDLPRLIKIAPPALPESIEHKEESHA